MILTNCAACAAPLAHNAPRCVRCHTRYCNATCQHRARTARHGRQGEDGPRRNGRRDARPDRDQRRRRGYSRRPRKQRCCPCDRRSFTASVGPLDLQTTNDLLPFPLPRASLPCNLCYATSSRARTWPGASPLPEATTPAVRLRKSRSRSRSHLARRRDRRGGVTGPAGATS